MSDRNWYVYIFTFAIAFIITLYMTPLSKILAFRLDAIDYPKERGMHKEPMPRIGGIAIVIGFMSALFLAYPYMHQEISMRQFAAFVISTMMIILLGLVDDIVGLKAKTKLLFQTMAALLVIWSGIRINVVMWPFTIILQKMSVPITLLWIIGVTNAVNLIDGLDGLAAGVSSIAALCIMFLCIITGSEIAVILMAALAGSCFGFLPRNFNPAETFMGDVGSNFLGFVLAVSSIMGVFKGYALLALLLSTLSLALPIFETLFSMLRRTLNHQSVMQADRGHIHHKLIDRGFTHKEAVCILYLVSFLLAMGAIAIAIQDIRYIIISFLVFILLLFCLYWYGRKKPKEK